MAGIVSADSNLWRVRERLTLGYLQPRKRRQQVTGGKKHSNCACSARLITIRKGALFGAKINYFGPLGAPCLKRRLRIRAQLRPFLSELQQQSYNSPSEATGCRQGLKYALIVAAVVSGVEIIQQSKN